jgi:hypothetical protein
VDNTEKEQSKFKELALAVIAMLIFLYVLYWMMKLMVWIFELIPRLFGLRFNRHRKLSNILLIMSSLFVILGFIGYLTSNPNDNILNLSLSDKVADYLYYLIILVGSIFGYFYFNLLAVLLNKVDIILVKYGMKSSLDS